MPTRIRPPKIETYLEVAQVLAKQSTCNRGQVGAVIVKDGRIVSTGWNGSPPGLPHCVDVGCAEFTLHEVLSSEEGDRMVLRPVEFGCQRTIHAEANAIIFAARHGIATWNSQLFCTAGPCLRCAQLIISAGIEDVTYLTPYRDGSGEELLSEAGVSCVRYSFGTR